MSVATSLRYIKRPLPGCSLSLRPSESDRTQGLQPDVHPVNIADLRVVKALPTLLSCGFQLVTLDKLPVLLWSSFEEVENKYYPYLQELIKGHTGASRVVIYDQRRRSGSVDSDRHKRRAEKPNGPDSPAGGPHADYTLQSGPARAGQVLPQEAAQLSRLPYTIIQVWQPVEGPVDDSPLALADARSVAAEDLFPVDIPSPLNGETHSIYAVAHSPSHRWFYTSSMRTDEAYMFVGYNSRDYGFARTTPHSAFWDPGTSPSAPIRHSIEFRALALWDR